MARKRYNLAQTFLSSSLGGQTTDTAVSFTVPLKEGGLAGTNIPTLAAGDYLVLKIDDEIMYLTSYTSGATTGTVLRAREGSLITTHDSGAPARHVLTKNDMYGDNLWNPSTPDLHPLTDEFNGSTIDPAWTRVDRTGNSATLTYTQGSGVMSLLHNAGTDLSSEFHGLVKPLNGASWPLTLESCIRWFGPHATNYMMNGIGFTDSTTYGTGKGLIMNGYSYNVHGSLLLNSYVLNNWLSGAEWFAGQSYQFPGSRIYFKIKWEASNTFSSWFSGDGVSWITGAVNVAQTLTPTHIGLFHGHYGGTFRSITTWEYFRVY